MTFTHWIIWWSSAGSVAWAWRAEKRERESLHCRRALNSVLLVYYKLKGRQERNIVQLCSMFWRAGRRERESLDCRQVLDSVLLVYNNLKGRQERNIVQLCTKAIKGRVKRNIVQLCTIAMKGRQEGTRVIASPSSAWFCIIGIQ